MNKSKFVPLLLALLMFAPISAYSAPLNLSNTPLYLGGSVAPNVMFLLDDSGSMQFETMPDTLTNLFSQSCCTNYQMWVYPRVSGLHGDGDYANATRVPSFRADSIMGLAYRSAFVNTLYYNPSVTYRPWVDRADKKKNMPDADPETAPNRPLYTEFGTRNLIINNTQTARWIDDRSNSHDAESRTFYPAVYSTYIGPEITDINAAITNAASPLWIVGNYKRTEIRSTKTTYSGEGRENRTDCLTLGTGVCSYGEEIQNFANWYTYHRSRIFASRAGIGRAFSSQPDSLRVGFGAINKGSTTIDGKSTGAVISGVRDFSESGEDFYNRLYTIDIPAQGTPLRRALQGAGEYFSRTDSQGPWSTTPGKLNGEDLICRQSYSILMSDGAASGDSGNAATGARANNNDGTSDNSSTNTNPEVGEPDFSYSPAHPFQDNRSNTLADVAMYYWKRDLRTDLENRVPTNNTDTAFWQHMTTFTVGLGVSGSIDPDDAFAAIDSGTSINWGDPDYGEANCTGAACIARQDDFLHAALNSRGGFFSAADPDTFATELENVLFAIQGREESSASSVALNTGSISSDSRVFQALFDPRDWSGQLLSFKINTTPGQNLGNLIMPAEWDARNLVPEANSRKIITYNGANGKPYGRPFRYSYISEAQQLLLKNELTLNYIRGDQSNEISNNKDFRNRTYLLGDIINSNPALVAAPIQRYPDNWGAEADENAAPYSEFREDYKSRPPVVYVGANDGMLHAFDASSGVELFGYVPGAVYRNLSFLTNPNYAHRYYVDGSPTIVDAFVNEEWRSILVSGLGAGGQGIFALDVTTPPDSLSDNETNIANKVLWEYTDETDADSQDMGFTFGQPSIVRLQNGQWAALFSGGYNNIVDNNVDGETYDSTTGNAVLYLVDLSDGSLIEKFDTKKGTENDPSGNNRPNGFASPAAVDVDGVNRPEFFGGIFI